MSTVATLDTVMRLNSTAFRAGMIDAAAQANKSLGSIQKQAAETAGVLLQLKRAAGAAGSLYLVKQGFDGLVDAQKQLQAIHYTFQAATGSATRAADAFAFVTSEAAKLGLVMPDSADGFAKLSASATAAGVSMKDQQGLFDAYAKSAVTLHLSTTQSSRALLALEQMFAKGKIQAQELRLQLGQAIPGAAMRFQNAVLQMTKGTNLAGKSFDQLLEAGDLTTSKFLPALVQALQESGRGWEDASHGLQAELNRVQTAWFNLKAEVSGGLFGDAVTVGARVLANNLASVASALTAVAGVAAARSLGGLLQSGAGKAERYAQEAKGSQMAAAAEREYAEAQMASARAAQAEAADEARKAETTLAATESVKGQARAARDLAKADFEVAASQKLAADTRLAQLGPARINSKDIVARAAQISAAEAQAVLVKAERQYNAALAAGNTTREQATVLQSNLNKARIAAIAAADDLAIAEARLAAARDLENALGGIGAAAGRAAKSFGTFIMGLAGGPWGLAIAAVGGLAYAYYEVQKAAEDYRAETAEQVKSLHQVGEEAKTAADNFGKLHDNMTLASGVETFLIDDKQISKAKGELADLQQQAQSLQDAISSRAQNPNEGTALMDWWDGRKLAQVNERIAELQGVIPPAASAVDDLRSKLGFGLEPSVDALKEAFDRLKAGGGIRDILAGLGVGFDAGVAALDAAKAKVADFSNQFDAAVKHAQKDLDTRGKSQYQIGQMLQDQAVEQIKAQTNLTKAQQDAQIAQLKSAQAAGLLVLKQDDGARSAKKDAAAVNAQAQEYKSLQASIQSRIEQDKQAVEQTSTLTEAQKLQIRVDQDFAEGKTKLNGKQQDYIRGLLATAVAQSEVTRATLLQRDADKSLADLNRQLLELQTQQNLANVRALEGAGKGSLWNQQAQAIEQIQDQYRRMRVEQDKAYDAARLQHGESTILDNEHAQALGKITAAEQEAIVAQRKFFDQQKAENEDWSIGARAALNDYVDAADNVAAQTKDLFTSAFGSMEDSLTNFVTTGKLDFKGLVTSILADLAKMELRIAMSKILTSVLGYFMAGSAMSNGDISANMDSSVSGDISGYQSDLSTINVSGGRASGGPVAGGNLYEVAEGGKPELLTSGGRTYLMMGAEGGQVTPASSGAGAGGGGTVNVSVGITVVQNSDGSTSVNSDTKALDQFGKTMAAQMEATARRVMVKGLMPGGDIYKATRMGAPA